MEWWQIALGVVVVLWILTNGREAGTVRRDIARLDRKLRILARHMNISEDELSGLSERVKEIARDPGRKIEAIKAYREETGAGLAEAKEAVEAWIESRRTA